MRASTLAAQMFAIAQTSGLLGQRAVAPPARPVPPTTQLSTIISPNEAFGFFTKLKRH